MLNGSMAAYSRPLLPNQELRQPIYLTKELFHSILGFNLHQSWATS
jgi:hypothetical protein